MYVQTGFLGSGYANADVITVAGNTLYGQTPLNDLTFQVNGVGPGGELSQLLNSTQNVQGNSAIYSDTNRGNVITRASMAEKAAGGQFDNAPAANTNLTANNAVLREIVPREEIDFTQTENGKYSILTNASPLGEMPATGTADYGIRVGMDVEFANNQTVVNYLSAGQNYLNQGEIPPNINTQTEFVVTEEMVKGTIKLEAFNTLADVGGVSGTAGFTNIKEDMFRVNKGDLGDFSFDQA